MVSFLTVPDAPPEMVNASIVNSSTIHVSWGDVPCSKRNGEITGYIVEYSRRGGEMVQKKVNLSANRRCVSITGLDPLTEHVYIVRVAAVNINGTGDFVNVTITESRMSITCSIDH